MWVAATTAADVLAKAGTAMNGVCQKVNITQLPPITASNSPATGRRSITSAAGSPKRMSIASR